MSIVVSRPKPENTGTKSSSNQICQRLLIVFFAAAMVLPSSGCATNLRLGSLGFGDAILESYRDRVWAKRAFNLRFNNCDMPYQAHFQSGFVAGYCDTCNGGDGFVPPVPPSEYRGFEFQSPDGAECVKTWFKGFPAGVAAARKDRAGEFHDMYTSRLINSAITQDKAKHILPNDVPVLTTNEFGVPQTSGAAKEPAAKLDNGIVGSSNVDQSRTAAYVAPPSTSNNPLLNPRSLTPSDLVQAPAIRKVGPTAMAPVSKMQQFTIDPSVKVQPSIASPTAAPIATVDESLVSGGQSPASSTPANVPPIVSTHRSQVVSQPVALPPIIERTATAVTAPVAEVNRSQTPLPMAVRSARNGWRSQTSSRRR